MRAHPHIRWPAARAEAGVHAEGQAPHGPSQHDQPTTPAEIAARRSAPPSRPAAELPHLTTSRTTPPADSPVAGQRSPRSTWDIVGVGFGPSNLALAITLEEAKRRTLHTREITATFLEKQPSFGWHRGMLLDGTRMQVSFLKDLVTLRNPRSEFSFLSYLYERGRLVDFINRKSMIPSRLEFHDYLEWVADALRHFVEYDAEVIEIRPVEERGVITALDVVTRSASVPEATRTRRARNLVVAAGLDARLPEGVTRSERVWHNFNLLERLRHLPTDAPRRFIVVGAGQSAAETTAHLHREFPQAEVCAVFARYGYSPADDSSFVNRIFDPEAVDTYFSAPTNVKQMLLAYHGGTNYAAVDMELIDDLYTRHYEERVAGRERLRLFNASRVMELQEHPDAVRVVVESLASAERTTLDADVIVFATGYRPIDPVSMLGDVGALCLRDEAGQLRVERDYRVVTAPKLQCGIYVQGATEHTHGISSTLLSNAAVRAGEILDSVVARTPARAQAAGGGA